MPQDFKNQRWDRLSGQTASAWKISRRKLLAGAAGTLSVAAFPAWSASTLRAQRIRFGRHDGFVRMVIEFSERPPYSVFLLPAPHRVVVDFPEVVWELPGQSPSGGDLVSFLRYGLFQPGNSRLVLELARPALVRQAFVLPPSGQGSWRFALDLSETTDALFAAAAGPARRIGTFTPPPPPSLQTESPSLAPSPRLRDRKPVIVLDPGHGGLDPGAIGVRGTYEKDITLSAGREFRRLLQKSGKFEVHLTRDRDVFLPLRDRIAIARRHRADLFVSLHADANANPQTKGLSVYTLSERASDSEAAALADSENKADIIGGIDLTNESAEVTNILINLAQRETMNLSSRMAEGLIAELEKEVTLLPRSHRFAGFVVLKAPDIPSILVEMGYLSNVEEEKMLRTEKYRNRLGTALTRGIERYFAALQQT